MKSKTVLTVIAALLALSVSAGAAEVTLINPGFENPELGEDGWIEEAPPGWTQIGTGIVGAWNPTADDFDPTTFPEGKNLAYAYQSGVTYMPNGLAQVLSEKFKANMTYRLTVEVGNCWSYFWPGYSVQLLAGGTVIAEDYNTVWPDYLRWETSIVLYKYKPAHVGLVGQPLEIRLLNLGINTDDADLDSYFEVEFDYVRLEAFFDMNPSPADGATIYAGDVDLSWTNMDPNEGFTDVYVDVWFGLDPNNPQKPGNWTKIIDATEPEGENATTVTVSAPIVENPPTKYYWRVDSYIFGSPTGEVIKGVIFRFNSTNDLPPSSVDSGDDMVTWSGEGVQLSPTVIDDGEPEDLSYLWSAAPSDGVVFSATDIEDPTVTITKTPGAAPVIIVNAGFEDPALDDGDYTYRPTGWREGWYDLTAPDPTAWGGYSWAAGALNPDADHGYGGVAPQGENVAFTTSYTGYDCGLAQVLSATLETETQYDLSALVGNPAGYNEGKTADYRIELLAGDVLIASDTGPSPTDDTTWITASCSYPATDSPAQLGEPLEIRLIAVDYTSGYEVDFDEIKLVAYGRGAPAAVYALTLAVNDQLNPPVKDTMTIDVYDDACLAAIGMGLRANYPGDFDGNCITDLEDLAVMISTWLNETALTEPAPKL